MLFVETQILIAHIIHLAVNDQRSRDQCDRNAELYDDQSFSQKFSFRTRAEPALQYRYGMKG
jgi:hypothetical protein